MDCVVEWQADFGPCVNGAMVKEQVVVTQPQGVGAACPELQRIVESKFIATLFHSVLNRPWSRRS